MIYFISDLHFGHANLITKGSRPQFDSVKMMDQTMIQNWNSIVEEDDEVYIVGDFSFLSRHPAEVYLGALKGKKHLIIGNHDAYWLNKMKYPERYFYTIGDIIHLEDKEKQITLCHYPWLEWPGCRGVKSKPGYMIHGHVHGNKNRLSYQLIKDHKISSSTIDKLRKNKPMNTTTINDLCRILNCRVEHIMEYLPSAKDQKL